MWSRASCFHSYVQTPIFFLHTMCIASHPVPLWIIFFKKKRNSEPNVTPSTPVTAAACFALDSVDKNTSILQTSDLLCHALPFIVLLQVYVAAPVSGNFEYPIWTSVIGSCNPKSLDRIIMTGRCFFCIFFIFSQLLALIFKQILTMELNKSSQWKRFHPLFLSRRVRLFRCVVVGVLRVGARMSVID